MAESPQKPVGSGTGDARRELMRVGAALAVVWAVGGWIGCVFALPPALHLAFLPITCTSWPVAQVLRAVQSCGLSAQARPGAVPVSFLFFVAWAVVLWLPLLLVRSRRLPIILFVLMQAAVLLVSGLLSLLSLNE